MTLPPWLMLPLAWLAFLALAMAVQSGVRALPPGPAWRPQAALKVSLLAGSLLVAAAQGWHLDELGFCRPSHDVWWSAIGWGLLLGAAATFVVLSSGRTGLRSLMTGYSFPAIVLWIWIGSSVSEEVFCRGWFQTASGGLTDTALLTLLPSALLFGAMHVLLWFAGVDRLSVTVIVTATTLLGLVTAWARVASGSLYPAIAAHVAFNVGGAVCGIGFTIIVALITGKPPAGRA